jgi:hypothetical protein
MDAIFVNAGSKGDGTEGAKSVTDNLRSKCKEFAKKETDETGLKLGAEINGSEYSPLPRRKTS